MSARRINPETQMSATLTAAEWNVIWNALQEIPYKLAAPIIQKIAPQLKPNGVDANVVD